MTIGGVLAFVDTYPASRRDSLQVRHYKRGIAAGYPPCCAEFYSLTIALKWNNEPVFVRYWELDQVGNPGYVRCPRCLGLPMDRRLT